MRLDYGVWLLIWYCGQLQLPSLAVLDVEKHSVVQERQGLLVGELNKDMVVGLCLCGLGLAEWWARRMVEFLSGARFVC
jgi:hypothetical protein